MLQLSIVVLLALAISAEEIEDSKLLNKLSDTREKKLLFYDEEGNLVKTFSNYRLHGYPQNFENKAPLLWNFYNPFLNNYRPADISPQPYMLPLSDEAAQQLNKDTVYQNKFFYLPARDAEIEPNPLCAGKREPIPSPKACSSFLNCWDGWAFEQQCPAGLLFSEEGYCDYADKVDCSSRRRFDTTRSELPQCSKDFESFRDESRCNEFFVCVNRQPIRFKCPANLAYSPQLGVCDYPDRVQCTFTPSKAPSTSSPDPSSEDPPAQLPATESDKSTSSPPPMKTIISSNSLFSSQSWSSTHVAMSRQDAIRQLQLGRIADVNTA